MLAVLRSVEGRIQCRFASKFQGELLSRGIEIWVVYDSPLDLPGVFVARKWVNDVPTEETSEASTLEGIRGKLPAGLYRIPRFLGDELQVVESWI